MFTTDQIQDKIKIVRVSANEIVDGIKLPFVVKVGKYALMVVIASVVIIGVFTLVRSLRNNEN